MYNQGSGDGNKAMHTKTGKCSMFFVGGKRERYCLEEYIKVCFIKSIMDS